MRNANSYTTSGNLKQLHEHAKIKKQFCVCCKFAILKIQHRIIQTVDNYVTVYGIGNHLLNQERLNQKLLVPNFANNHMGF